MAAEKSDPRVGLIVTVTVASLTTFLVLRGVLVSYFYEETHEEEQHKYLGVAPEQRNHEREFERQRLENGPVPITQAMQIVAQGGRPALIAPQPSTDYSPMQGWLQRPLQFTPPTAAATPPTAQPVQPPGSVQPMQGGPAAVPAPPAGAAAPTNPEQQQSATGTTGPTPTTGNPPTAPTVQPGGNGQTQQGNSGQHTEGAPSGH